MADRRCHMKYVFGDFGASYGNYFNLMENYFFHSSNTQPSKQGRRDTTQPHLHTQQPPRTHCTKMGLQPTHGSKCATMWSTKLAL